MVKRAGLVASLASACLLLSGCTVFDMVRLASDDTAGRQNDTAGSATARAYLIDQLRPIARGLNPAGTGDAAYTQPFSGGRNVVAVIPGTDLADQYVIVGAHYDGLGTSCQRSIPSDQICNGATDNATGVTAALALGALAWPTGGRGDRWSSRSGTARRTACSARGTTSRPIRWCRSRRPWPT